MLHDGQRRIAVGATTQLRLCCECDLMPTSDQGTTGVVPAYVESLTHLVLHLAPISVPDKPCVVSLSAD